MRETIQKSQSLGRKADGFLMLRNLWAWKPTAWKQLPPWADKNRGAWGHQCAPSWPADWEGSQVGVQVDPRDDLPWTPIRCLHINCSQALHQFLSLLCFYATNRQSLCQEEDSKIVRNRKHLPWNSVIPPITLPSSQEAVFWVGFVLNHTLLA